MVFGFENLMLITYKSEQITNILLLKYYMFMSCLFYYLESVLTPLHTKHFATHFTKYLLMKNKIDTRLYIISGMHLLFWL